MRRFTAPLGGLTLAGLTLALLLAAPMAAHAQGKRMGADRQRHNPISLMIEHRAELGLADEQVSQLEAIRDRYLDQNKALREQIHQVLGDRKPSADRKEQHEQLKDLSHEERREAMKKHHEELLAKHPELAPAFDQLKANREAMHQEVHAILTPAQQDKVKQLHREMREKARLEGRGHGQRNNSSGT